MPEDQPVNPYAAPTTFSHEKMTFARFEVRGKRLAIQDGAVLPARCIKTNQEVDPDENGRLQHIKLAWSSPWWALLIFLPLGILIYIIVALSTRKSGIITVYLTHEAIRQKRIWLGALVLLAFLIPVLVFMVGVEYLLMIGIAIFSSLVLLLVALFTIRFITPVKHKDGWFLIRGINREYLRDLETPQI